MQSRCSGFLMVVCLLVSLAVWGQNAQNAPQNGGDFSTVIKPDPAKVVPKDTIIVKGAWAGASDSTTPVPEGSGISNNVLTNQYFGITYTLPQDWRQKYTGPPPSDSGRYVLAQLTPAPTFKGPAKGTVLITAQDMFFTPLPASNTRQLVNYSKNHLQEEYKLELKPTETRIAGQTFIFYAYQAPVAGIHWYVFSTQIRCHAVQIVLSSQDTRLLESLVQDLNKMKLPAEASPTAGTGGGAVPVCVKDYARPENVLERVDPILTVRRFNPIPVRIIIDKEGKVKHIHFISAFPEQEKIIGDALKQWKFRPYERDGQKVEVETGIMFGSAPPSLAPTPADAATD